MAPSPKKRPGPKSKTQSQRESATENGDAASTTSKQTYDPTKKVYRCRYCRRVFRESGDLRQHKLDTHMDVMTHLTEGTVAPLPHPDQENLSEAADDIKHDTATAKKKKDAQRKRFKNAAPSPLPLSPTTAKKQKKNDGG